MNTKTKKLFEILTIAIVLVWGTVFLYFYFSRQLDLYLKPKFHPWVVIAGFGLLLLGILNFIFLNKDTGVCSHEHAGGDDHDHHHHGEECDHDHHHHGEECDHDHHHHHGKECDHDHHHHHHDEVTPSSLAFALVVLALPLLMAARYSEGSFSPEYTKKWMMIEDDMMRIRARKGQQGPAASPNVASPGQNPYSNPGGAGSSAGAGTAEPAWGKFTIEDLKKMVPQTSRGDFLLDVPQIFYTAGDRELMDVMEGISVQTEAQIIEEPDKGKSNRLRAYRLLIECCAADARPVSIPLEFAETLPSHKEMGWYLVVGRLHFEEGKDNEFTPILQVKSFDPTVEPADWMTRY